MLTFKKADKDDLEIYFNWANDAEVRLQSFQSTPINFQDHTEWFLEKIGDDNSMLLVFFDDGNPAGQVRIDKKKDSIGVIGIAIDKKFRGKGLAAHMISISSKVFLQENLGYTINAYIKKENLGSIKSFEKAGYIMRELLFYQNIPSVLFTKSL